MNDHDDDDHDDGENEDEDAGATTIVRLMVARARMVMLTNILSPKA